MLHVDVDLIAGERRPQQHASAPRKLVLGEGKPGTRRVKRRQIRLRGAVCKYPVEREEQTGVGRRVTARVVVLELRRVTRHVIDDDIGHDVGVCGKRRDVLPRAQPGIHLRVIDRIETGE